MAGAERNLPKRSDASYLKAQSIAGVTFGTSRTTARSFCDYFETNAISQRKKAPGRRAQGPWCEPCSNVGTDDSVVPPSWEGFYS
jgi:hypothetical protein